MFLYCKGPGHRENKHERMCKKHYASFEFPKNNAGIIFFQAHITQLVTSETSGLKWLTLLFVFPLPNSDFFEAFWDCKGSVTCLCPAGIISFWPRSCICKNLMESVITKADSFPRLCMIQATQRAEGAVASRYTLQRWWEHDLNRIPINYHLVGLLHLAIAGFFVWCLIYYWTLSDLVGHMTSTMSNHLFVVSYC